MLVLTLVLVAACATLGQGVLALCGWQRWAWWSPALGYAALLIIFGQAIRLPHRLTGPILISAVLAVAPLALRPVRRAVREALPDGVALSILALLLAAIPFFAIGRTGILGASVSNDMAQHLTAASWLRTHDGMLPVAAIGGDLITTGYPIGPHSLAAGISHATGIGDVRAFSAETLAIPVMTVLAAFGVMPGARRGARWALAIAVGLGYLPVAYLAQGSFKEIAQALFVLATALALNDVFEPARGAWRRGIPIGLFLGGTIYNYSYGGAAWILGAAAFFIFLAVFRNWPAVGATLKRLALPALSAVVAGVAVIAPEFNRIQLFQQSIFGVEPLENHGNLYHAINPLTTLGVWFSGDFRLNPSPEWISFLASAVALALLLYGVGWTWRRRELGLPAALLAGFAIWTHLTLTINIYNAAKGLVVMAPVAMSLIGAPLAMAWSARAATPRRRTGLVIVRVVSVALLAGALIASFGILRSAPVGLGPHEAELDSIRPLIHGKSVLYLNSDHFAEWELRGANPIFVTGALYAPARLGQHPQKQGGNPVDIDNFGSRDLDNVDFVLTQGGAYQSEIPPNFKLVRQTPSFLLYRRHGRTPEREPVEPPGLPGVPLDCRHPRIKNRLAQYAPHPRAGILPPPVVLSTWSGTIAQPGNTASMRVRLPRGHWDVSLQYVSTTDLDVRAPGLSRTLAANYGLVIGFWPAGTLSSDGRPLTLSVTSHKRSWFGELLGAPRPMRAPIAPNESPIWQVAFTRHGETPRRVAALSHCGRYTDWVSPAGGRMGGRRLGS